MSVRHWVPISGVAVLALSLVVCAQVDRGNATTLPGGAGGAGPVGPTGAGGGFGPGGGFRLPDDMRTQIGASEEEWKVIGPMIRRVTIARQIVEVDDTDAVLASTDASAAGMVAAPFGRGPRGGGFDGPGDMQWQGGGQGNFRGNQGVAPADRQRGGIAGPLRAIFGGGGGGGGVGAPPRGGRGGPFGASNPLTLARADLKAALDDPKMTPAEIEERVAAVRVAIAKANAELAGAQSDLRPLLTAGQEAILVSLGYLD